MKVIGVTGTIGAGKGTVVDYLVTQQGYKHYSVRSFIKEEIIARNMPLNRDSMVVVANDLRAKNSSSYITDQLFYKAKSSGGDCVIESIRTPGEIFSLRDKGGFFLIAVDADPRIRYERIMKRGSETDHITFETFINNEQREMTSNDPNNQNLKRCIEMSDVCFMNNGEIQELYRKVEKYIGKITISK